MTKIARQAVSSAMISGPATAMISYEVSIPRRIALNTITPMMPWRTQA
jgi:hypothetical protein